MRFKHDSQALAALNRWRRAHPGAIVSVEYSTRQVRVRLHALCAHRAGSLRQAAANALTNFERDSEEYARNAADRAHDKGLRLNSLVHLPPRKFVKRAALVNRGDG